MVEEVESLVNTVKRIVAIQKAAKEESRKIQDAKKSNYHK